MDYSVNYLAVLVSAVLAFGIGSLWYGPLFGKAWQKGVGLSDEEIKGANMGKLFGSAFIMALIVSFGMAMFFFGFGPNPDMNAGMGAMYGIMTGIFFIFPSTAMNYLFARKSATLIAIDSCYHIVAYTLVGVILGAWQ